MANNRIAYGLCKEYGIDLPKGATPTDAWKALEDKGITQDDAFQKASKSSKQGTSYEDIMTDTAKQLNDLGKKTAAKEYGGKGVEASDHYEENREKLFKKANAAGLNLDPWQADDLYEEYDGDYSDESMDKFIGSLKDTATKGDTYSGIVNEDSKPKANSLEERLKNTNRQLVWDDLVVKEGETFEKIENAHQYRDKAREKEVMGKQAREKMDELFDWLQRCIDYYDPNDPDNLSEEDANGIVRAYENYLNNPTKESRQLFTGIVSTTDLFSLDNDDLNTDEEQEEQDRLYEEEKDEEARAASESWKKQRNK